MHFILTGATGLVGAAALDAMLHTKAITQISILSRRPVPMAEGHSQVKVFLQNDFSSYDSSVLEQLKGANGCVWALGISANDVNKEDYVKITHDYAMKAAEEFSGLSPSFNFVYVSGEGATATPGVTTPYFGRIKGQTEVELLDLAKQRSALNMYVARPGGVDPAGHSAILPFVPKIPLVRNAASTVLLPALRLCYKRMLSPTKELGTALVDLAMKDGKPLDGAGIEGEGRIVTNVGLRRLAGL